MKDQSKPKSFIAFGERWDELPEYAGYLPKEGKWLSVKDEFYLTNTHSNINPKFVILQKDNEQLPVYVYGLKVPYICLGTGKAVTDNVAFCKIVSTGGVYRYCVVKKEFLETFPGNPGIFLFFA